MADKPIAMARQFYESVCPNAIQLVMVAEPCFMEFFWKTSENVFKTLDSQGLQIIKVY